MIRKDAKISTRKIAKNLNINARTVKRHIKELSNIHFKGYSGYWVIDEEDDK